MKIMAIDLGDVRTGIAFSDITGLIAGRSFTVTERNRQKLAEKICALIREEQPEQVVLGLPVNMDGTEGERAALSREFALTLEQGCGMKILLRDERGSSISANRILSDAGKKREKQRARVDAVAASIILQNYLDELRLKKRI